jgi:hypothetical protein
MLLLVIAPIRFGISSCPSSGGTVKQVGIKYYICNVVARRMYSINQEFVYSDALNLVGENTVETEAKVIIQTGKEIRWQRLTGDEVCYFKAPDSIF